MMQPSVTVSEVTTLGHGKGWHAEPTGGISLSPSLSANFARILHAPGQFTYFDLIDPAYDPVPACQPSPPRGFARRGNPAWHLVFCEPWVQSYIGESPAAINVLVVLIRVGNGQSLSLPIRPALFTVRHIPTFFQSRDPLRPRLQHRPPKRAERFSPGLAREIFHPILRRGGTLESNQTAERINRSPGRNNGPGFPSSTRYHEGAWEDLGERKKKVRGWRGFLPAIYREEGFFEKSVSYEGNIFAGR